MAAAWPAHTELAAALAEPSCTELVAGAGPEPAHTEHQQLAEHTEAAAEAAAGQTGIAGLEKLERTAG